jgi:hypothetical protein
MPQMPELLVRRDVGGSHPSTQTWRPTAPERGAHSQRTLEQECASGSRANLGAAASFPETNQRNPAKPNEEAGKG